MLHMGTQIWHSNGSDEITCVLPNDSLIRMSSSARNLKRPSSDALSRTNSITSIADESFVHVGAPVQDCLSVRRVRPKGFLTTNSVKGETSSNDNHLPFFSSPAQSFTTGDFHPREFPFWFNSPVPSFSSGENTPTKCCSPLTSTTTRNDASSKHSSYDEELDQPSGSFKSFPTCSHGRVPTPPEYVCSDRFDASAAGSLELQDGCSEALNRFMESVLNDLDRQDHPEESSDGHYKSITRNQYSTRYATYDSTLAEESAVMRCQNSVIAKEAIESCAIDEPSEVFDVLSDEICSLLQSPSWDTNKINSNIDIQESNSQQASLPRDEKLSGDLLPSGSDASQQQRFHSVDLSADVNCLWKPHYHQELIDELQICNAELTQGKCLQEDIYKFYHTSCEDPHRPVGLQENNQRITTLFTKEEKPVLDPTVPVSLRATSISPDADYNGIRLIHLLIACSEAVASHDMGLGTVVLTRLKELVSPIGSTIQRVAAYFCDGLQCRIEGGRARDKVTDKKIEYSDALAAFQILHETSPYIKFGQFTANQAILDAVKGEKRIHIIDYEIMEGIQWPSLMQALISRRAEPPHLRITSLYRPHDKQGFSTIQETGKRLTEFAASLNLPFTFNQVKIDSEENFRSSAVKIIRGEVVVGNCCVHLPHMPHRTVNSVSSFLQGIRKLCPRVLTLVEEELECTSSSFTSHFFEALHYYSAIFDSLDVTLSSQPDARALVERVFLAPRIASTLKLCGSSNYPAVRVEFAKRNWCSLLTSSGFRAVSPSVDNLCQANLLLGLFKDGFQLHEDHNRLLLAWRSKPLIAASSWTCDVQVR